MKTSALFQNTISSFFLKRARTVKYCAVFAVYVLCAIGAWGTEYTWTDRVTDSNWKNVNNWGGSGYPGTGDTAIFTGNTEVTVVLDADITISTIKTGTGGANKVTIDTKGHTLTASSSFIVNAEFTGSSDTNTVITGGGSVETKTFDFPDKNTHNVTIGSGTTLKISETLYGNAANGGTLTFKGSGTLYLPASGANVDYGESKITYDRSTRLKVLPCGNPTYYNVTATRLDNFPSNNITITITRASNEREIVYYPYTFTTTNTGGGTFSFNGQNGDSDGSLSIAASTLTEDITLSYSGTLAAGDGFTLTIKTPDNSMELAVISYYKDKPRWTGAESSDWNIPGNWAGITNISEITSTSEITINSGISNYPEISTNVSLKSLTITSNAKVTMKGGTLTVDKLICTGNSNFTATDDGTVVFGNSETDAEFSADYPDNSSFCNVEITAGKNFTSSNSMTVTENFTSNGNTTLSSGTLTVSGTTTVSSGTKMNVKNADFGGNVTNNGEISCGGGEVTFGSTLTNNGTITGGSGAVTFGETVNSGEITCSTTSTIFNGAVTVEASGTITGTDGAVSFDGIVTNGGTITGGAGEVSFGSTLTNDGTITGGSGELLFLESVTNDGTITAGNSGNDTAAVTFSQEYAGTGGTLVGSDTDSTYIDFYGNTEFGNVTVNKSSLRFMGSTAQTFTPNGQSVNAVIFANTGGTTLNGSLTADGLITVSGILSCGSPSAITSNAGLTIENSGTLNAGNSEITLSNGTEWNNGGMFNCGTGTVIVSDSATILGENTFYNFKCTTAGATVTFEAGKTQTVSGNFTVTGSTDKILLTSDNTWTIDVSPAKTKVKNAIIQNSKSLQVLAGLTGTDVDYTTWTDNGGNINWFSASYIWKGSENTDWDTAENWTDTNGQPVAVAPQTNNNEVDITIGKVDEPAKNTLEVNSDLSLKSITVNSGSTIDLASHSVKTKDTDIGFTNNGTVRLEGTGTQSITGTMINGSGSTVEYYGTVGTSLPWDGDSSTGKNYENIAFTTGASASDITDTVTVFGTTTIDTGSSDVKLSSTGNSFSGKITVTTRGAVSITAADTVKIADGAECNSLEINGNTALYGNVTTTGAQAYNGNVTLYANSSLIANSGGTAQTVTLGKDSDSQIKTDGTMHNLSVGKEGFFSNCTVKGKFDAQFGSFTVYGETTVFDGGAVTAGTQSYNGAVTVFAGGTITGSSGAVTFGGTVTNDGKISGSTGRITFRGTYGSSTATEATPAILTASSGNTYFSSDADFSYTTFTANGGTVVFNSATGQTLKLANATTFNKTSIQTSVGRFTAEGTPNGKLIANTLTLINTNADAIFNIPINAKTIEMKNTAETAGAVTFNNDATAGTIDNTTTDSSVINFDITFNAATEVKNPVTFGTTGTLTLGKNTEDTFIFKGGITHTAGNTTLCGKIITNSSPVVLSSDANIKTLTLTGNSTIQTTGAVGNETRAAITLGAVSAVSAVSGEEKTLSLTGGTGNITVYGAVGSEDSIIGDIIIESAGTVKFTGAIYSTDFTIASAKDVEFESTINCAQLTQTAGSGTSAFLDTVTASGAISLTGNIFTFAKDVTTNGELSVTHSGIFTIAEEADITADKGFIQYGTGTLAIDGTSSTTSITTKNAPISFNGSGTLTLNGDIFLTSSSDTANGGNININTPVEPADNSAQSLTLSAGKGNIYFSSDTGTTKRIKDISIPSASEVKFTNKLNANKISVTAEKITLTQTAKLDTAETAVFSNSGILLLEPGCSIEASTITQDGSGENQIAGTITAQEIILKNNTYIYNETEIKPGTFTVCNFTVGNDTTPASLANLYISALEGESPAQVTFNANVSIHGNYALFNGNVNQKGDLSVDKDIILLNGDTSTMYKDSSIGVADLFKYTGRNGSVIAKNSLSAFPNEMPDGTTINHNGKYISTFSILPGITISAGQNFYDNGTDLTPVGSWTLKLKANDKATDAFAELYNAKIVHCKVSPIDGGKAFLSAAENGTDADGRNNDGVFFSRPEILVHNAANAKDTDGNANLSGTYTVYDNVIRVEFVDSITKQPLKIENSSNEISAALEHIKFGSASTSQKIFEGAYTTAECTQSTDGKGDLSVFFLKTANSDKWNTDATGISSGANESTDWDGTHRTAIPYLNIPKALESVWQTLRDEHKNRISHYYTESPQLSSVNETYGATFTATADLCAPVLVGVRTGQELHTKNDGTAESQPFYDSHNFIELQYSEPVNTGNILLTSTEEETVQNTQVQDDFGKIDGTSGNGLTVSGLIKTAAGMLKTGSNGTEDNLVHSLYRKFSVNAGEEDSFNAHRLRISIAGYVDKSVSASRGSFKHWKGYIDSAETPSGTVTRISSPLIKDFNGNVLEAAGTSAHKLPELSVSSEESELYGKWDTLPPAFAVYKNITNNEDTGFEAIGTNDTDSTTLDRIEFHVFDNETNEPAWYIKTGWCSESKSLFTPFSYAADIFGGARPFSTEEKIRTSGGLRYASLYNKSSSFSYKIKGKPDTYSFGSDEITGGAKGLVFRTQSEITHTTGSEDGLYFSVHFADSSIPLKTTFEVTYNENGFVTDLAGNRMKSGTVTTIDRTAPTFNMSVGAVPDDSGNTYEELYIIFNKKLNTDAVTVYNNDGTTETKQFSEALRESLRFVDSKTQLPVSDIFVSTEKDVDVVFKNDNFTGLKIPLNRSLTYGDIKNLWIQAFTGKTSVDPLSGVENANITYIQDTLGNCLPHKSAHAISDFAINVVNPIYAYDTQTTEDGAFFSQQMYQDGSWAVHDWNAEQKNYGTLSAGYDLFIEANLSDGNGEAPADTTVFAYFDSTPDTQAVSVTYNENISGAGLSSWRIWLPNFIAASSATQERSPVFKALSPQNNVMSKQTVLAGIKGEMPADAKTENEMRFSLNSTTMENAGWKSGDQISFLFALSDANNNPVKICHAPEYDSLTDTYTTEESPLFALRLKNSGYLTSVDLWSFKLQDITKQRGGVTIFNNVINAANGEKTVVQVNMPSGGTLNVIVMTLDGNIVKYLQHGEASQGEHNYTWDGTTKSGKKVARGLYFIRVFGNGIDETRKVMVVK